MSRRVTVHTGPIWEMQLLQGRLEIDGIPSYIPDANIEQLDPFLAGAGAFAVRLQVPVRDTQQAAELVVEYIAATRERRPGRDEGDGEDAEARQLARLTKLGIRVRWTAVAAITTPIAIVLGLRYLLGVRRSALRPHGHRLTVFALLFWSIVGVGIVVGLLR